MISSGCFKTPKNMLDHMSNEFDSLEEKYIKVSQNPHVMRIARAGLDTEEKQGHAEHLTGANEDREGVERFKETLPQVKEKIFSAMEKTIAQ